MKKMKVDLAAVERFSLIPGTRLQSFGVLHADEVDLVRSGFFALSCGYFGFYKALDFFNEIDEPFHPQTEQQVNGLVPKRLEVPHHGVLYTRAELESFAHDLPRGAALHAFLRATGESTQDTEAALRAYYDQFEPMLPDETYFCIKGVVTERVEVVVLNGLQLGRNRIEEGTNGFFRRLEEEGVDGFVDMDHFDGMYPEFVPNDDGVSRMGEVWLRRPSESMDIQKVEIISRRSMMAAFVRFATEAYRQYSTIDHIRVDGNAVKLYNGIPVRKKIEKIKK